MWSVIHWFLSVVELLTVQLLYIDRNFELHAYTKDDQ